MDYKKAELVCGRYFHISYIGEFFPKVNAWDILSNEKYKKAVCAPKIDGKVMEDMVDYALLKTLINGCREKKIFEERFLKETAKELESPCIVNPEKPKREKIKWDSVYKKIKTREVLKKFPQYADEIKEGIETKSFLYESLDRICDEIMQKTGDCGTAERALAEISDVLLQWGAEIIYNESTPP